MGCTASCCTVGGICRPVVEPRAGLAVCSGNSSTFDGYKSIDLSILFSQFSGLIVTFGARILSILHVATTADAAGIFGMLSAKAFELLADTGPL